MGFLPNNVFIKEFYIYPLHDNVPLQDNDFNIFTLPLLLSCVTGKRQPLYDDIWGRGGPQYGVGWGLLSHHQ